MLIGFIVQQRLKSKFKKYSEVGLSNGLSGREIAEKMLSDNGIRDVKVISTPGKLTDHYNPTDKTVNLSEDVYEGRSVASAAVAAHECGHAVQHKEAYSWLSFRSAMVPIVSFSSKAMSVIFMLMIFGSFIVHLFPLDTVFLVVIILQAAISVFTLVTLPVEYDASNRALAWLKNKNIVSQEEYKGSEDALKWAARTYLVAAIGAIASLLYWALQVFGARD